MEKLTFKPSAPVSNDLVSSPLGTVPRDMFKDLMKKANINYNGDYPHVSLLDFAIVADTEEEANRYREMTSATRGKTGSTTCLKNYVETEIFKAFRTRYTNLREACSSYLQNKDTSIRIRVIDQIRDENNMSAESGANEFQLKRLKKDQKFKSL